MRRLPNLGEEDEKKEEKKSNSLANPVFIRTHSRLALWIEFPESRIIVAADFTFVIPHPSLQVLSPIYDKRSRYQCSVLQLTWRTYHRQCSATTKRKKFKVININFNLSKLSWNSFFIYEDRLKNRWILLHFLLKYIYKRRNEISEYEPKTWFVEMWMIFSCNGELCCKQQNGCHKSVCKSLVWQILDVSKDTCSHWSGDERSGDMTADIRNNSKGSGTKQYSFCACQSRSNTTQFHKSGGKLRFSYRCRLSCFRAR